MTKKKIFISLLLLALIVVVLIGGVYLVKQRQEIRKRATPATTIYLEPSTKTVNIDETVSFDILVNTGENALATVRLDIVYDNTFLQPLSFNFNSSLLPQSLRPVDFSQSGEITGSAGVTPGSLLSGTGQRVASLSFKTLSVAPSGTTIGFGPETSAYSATQAEPVGSNLITKKGSATVVITAPLEATLMPTPTSSPDSSGATPTPTSTPASTPTPILSPTPTPFQLGIGEEEIVNPTATPSPTTIPSTSEGGEEIPVTGGIIPTLVLFAGGIALIFSLLLFI